MKKAGWILTFVLVLLGMLALSRGLKHNSSADVKAARAPKEVKAPASPVPALAETRESVAVAADSARPAVRAPAATQNDLQSLENMSRTLFQFSRPASGIKALVDYLESTRQDPMVVRDANPYTGEMAIVRTRSPLPGTRYFHAQYFGDGDGQGFVQHMSFEFKPGPTAMAEAVQSVQRSFGLGAPKVQREDYAQWSLDEGYIVWVKKMDTADLQDDPFNAYTSADAGTIRVAIEAEIH